ncbi:MAG TPA: SCP2 sterol-binding domain-containing protein [Pyrinomonadaceae bacterium]|nr:SCP2 sterol-binding domain-containing protein [Pyrinomonadaceae bacterium]
MGYTDLEECLQQFRSTVNANQQVKKILAGWDRTILLEATDTQSLLTLVVQDRMVTDLKAGAPDENEDNLIHLQASEENLIKIFSGQYDASTALIDGELAVFSSEKDKVKLEAVSIVLWGM